MGAISKPFFLSHSQGSNPDGSWSMNNMRAGAATVFFALSIWGCSKPNARLVDLVAEFGKADAMHGEANYELKQRDDVLKREFELELENGKPGSAYPVAIDGIQIGEIKIDAAGEGKFSLSDAGTEARFPDNFVEPKVGSVLKVGDIYEGPLQEKPPRSKRK
jgi:hypothetical protein